ncbi:WD40 repeat-like protein [Rhizoclosmatium globosum]|uniref:WD40 repeat-like protein n=1 Tax=Rhizoclosmatium globosum TaxID=329046 RepID=A0A1Y2CNP9_9FUNG|nr:WD40 repeat-like protein [Rhizoclosmatium globosum]|eukprot:ORY48658.1 WD40 repeat-like protein [Rhizoclosmatium globosum]
MAEILASIKPEHLLPFVPKLTSPYTPETLAAQSTPLIYNFLYNKRVQHSSARKSACWGPWHDDSVTPSLPKTVNEIKGATVWTLSSGDYGSLVGKSEVRLYRASSFECMEACLRIAGGGEDALESNNMRQFDTFFIPKDSGRFLRAFRKRNMLITSWCGDAHAVWNLGEESPFKQPAILLSSQSTPATSVMEISPNDQMVAISYQNGSTYIWNMENSVLGDGRLLQITNVLHPDASTLKPHQKKVVALNFTCAYGSFPTIGIAYPDRINFVDVRSKRHIFSQLFHSHATQLTSMHWNEVDGTTVATGSSDGEIRIWDVRKITNKKAPEPVSTVTLSSEIEKLQFSPHCRELLMATRKDGCVTVLNSMTGKTVFLHQQHLGVPVFSTFWNSDPVHDGIVLSGYNVSAGEESEGVVQGV